MSQGKFFSFGVDKISFVDADFNVFAVDDPTNATLNMTYEITQHRGGANNDVRASAVHSRNAELTIGTAYIDPKLAQLLTGGTITSLPTSASSVTTGTANGANTLSGTTATVPAAVTTVTINSATLVKTTDYYVTASNFAEITVTRLEDGKQFTPVTLTNTGSSFSIDSERGIDIDTSASATSMTIGEKGIISVRQAINTVNQTIDFDSNKPGNLSVEITVDFEGYRRQISIPVAQPQGTIQGNSATEFQMQDVTLQVENSAVLDKLASMVLQG